MYPRHEKVLTAKSRVVVNDSRSKAPLIVSLSGEACPKHAASTDPTRELASVSRNYSIDEHDSLARKKLSQINRGALLESPKKQLLWVRERSRTDFYARLLSRDPAHSLCEDVHKLLLHPYAKFL